MIDIHSVEFYIIAAAIAAAVIALAALPSRRGAAQQRLLGGILSSDEPDAEPSVEITVDDNRRLHITRRGLHGVSDRGAVSLAIEIIGFDISIEERIVAGRGQCFVPTATFILDNLAPERYHIRYYSQPTGTFAAFTIPVKEGIRVAKELK